MLRFEPCLLLLACIGCGTNVATPSPSVRAGTSPAQLLGGLSDWHLTLPVGASDAATQVDQPQLDGYSDPYFFVADSVRAVRFIALFGGARTSASTAYARSELRQEYRGAGALPRHSWPCRTSAHSMHLVQRVVQTPPHKPEMSIGQIHDDTNDLLEVRYVGQHGVADHGIIRAHFNDDRNVQELDSGYHVGDTMVVDISTDGAGNVAVEYQNPRAGVTKRVTSAFYDQVSGGCYFKAGNYHQACSKLDINGQTNVACAAKGWPATRWETDPHGQSVLDIFELGAH